MESVKLEKTAKKHTECEFLTEVIILIFYYLSCQVKVLFRGEVKYLGDSFMVSHIPALSARNGMDNGQGDGKG